MNRIFLVLFSCFLFTSSFAQNKEVDELVDRFIDTLEKRSFMRHQVDFQKMRSETKIKVKNIQETDSLLTIFQSLVSSLKDHHSSVALSEEKDDEMALLNMLASTTYKQAGMPAQNFQHRMVNEKYAYINVPGVLLEHKRSFDTLQSQLLELDKQNPKAWIIDLTENDGGSYIPMVVPFHSLIDTNKTFSYFEGEVDEQGNKILKNEFVVPEDGFYADSSKEAKIVKLDSLQAVQLKNNKVPIIVLVSNITASSGEIFAAHFIGQRNVTLVGSKTNGLTSSNELIYVDKGYSVNLMTALLNDRNGKSYELGEGISPDIDIDFIFPKEMRSFSARLKYMKENKPLFLNKAIEILESKGI
ncbi:S41 family peptidase [Sphingobacterium kyonggiense]